MEKRYKYISFNNDYWFSPLLEKKMYFSTVRELRNPNDPYEFHHHWNYGSKFFIKYGHHFRNSYEQLFSNTRVLCMSTEFTEHCWQEFAKGDGVCYEFLYSQAGKAADITAGLIQYGEKEHNVPIFLFEKMSDGELKRILKKRFSLTKDDLATINASFRGETEHLFNEHILNELALKKPKTFRLENEFRYLHVNEGTPGSTVKTLMPGGKVSFDSLGLSLVKIYTSDLGKVKDILVDDNIPIEMYK